MPLQVLLAIAGLTSSITMIGLVGKLIKDKLNNKYQKSPSSLENTISLTELTELNEREADHCGPVEMIGIDNAALISSSL